MNIDSARKTAQSFLDRTDDFALLGLADASAQARELARAVLELSLELELARQSKDEILERHQAYAQFHQQHCFLPNGHAKVAA